MAPLAGFKVAAQIAGEAFTLSEYSLSFDTPDIDITNSEGASADPLSTVDDDYPGVYECAIPSNKVCQITVKKAALDLNDSPYATPFIIQQGAFITLKIFPDRLVNDPHDFPSVLVTSVKEEAAVKGQAVTWSFTARSNGKYTLSSD